MMGMELDSIVGVAVQDLATLSVAEYIGLDEAEACDMHDSDKIDKSAMGELVRSTNKVPVNPFPEGVQLMAKFQGMAKHFSSTLSHCVKYQTILDGHDDVSKTVIKQDLNKTRINARHRLLLSSLRIKRGMKLYQVTHSPNNFPTDSF